MDYLDLFYYAFTASVGFLLCAVLSANRRPEPSADGERLDWLVQKRAMLAVAADGSVYGVMAGSPPSLVSDTCPNPRTAIDSAMLRDRKAAVPR
jgi:hypothetical protein